MRILLPLIFTAFLAAPVSAQTQLEELDNSYAAAMESGDFVLHLALIEQVLSADKQIFEVLSRAARGAWAAADLSYWQSVSTNVERAAPRDVDDVLDAKTELTKEQGKRLIELGLTMWHLGESAVSVDPNRVEGHFYHGLGISFYALGKSILAALREGLRGKFDNAIDKSIQIDDRFFAGAPPRIKGRSFFKLPWPLRDYEKSIDFLKRAVQAAPNESVNYLFLGDSYWNDGQKDLALEAWKKVVELAVGKQTVQHYFLENARLKVNLSQTK